MKESEWKIIQALTESPKSWQAGLCSRYPLSLRMFFKGAEKGKPFLGCQVWGFECGEGWCGLLDKALGEPIDLIVQDQVLFRGWPVKSDGQYAVLIAECVCKKAENPDAIVPRAKAAAV